MLLRFFTSHMEMTGGRSPHVIIRYRASINVLFWNKPMAMATDRVSSLNAVITDSYLLVMHYLPIYQRQHILSAINIQIP